MAEAMAFASAATTQEAPTKAPVPPSKPISTKESTQVEKVVIEESTPILTEIPTPQKRVTPVGVSQTESTSPITPPVISASNPFVAFSHAVKNGSSLVVTPSFIPNSTTRGPDTNLSSNEGSEEVLKDSNDEPVVRTRVSDSDNASDDDEQGAEAMGMYPLSLLCLFFLFFLLFLSAIFYLLYILLLLHSYGHE